MNQNAKAQAEMLIRRPVAEVFEAFINPEIATKFWFTKSTGKLEAGKQGTCEWEMYGVSSQVRAKSIEKNKRILIDWDGCSGRETVEWVFTPHGNEATFVSVTNSGFRGSEDEIVKQARASGVPRTRHQIEPGLRSVPQGYKRRCQMRHPPARPSAFLRPI